MKELLAKIQEALLSALPITAIVYIMALTPWFDFSTAEMITFTVGAVLLIVGQWNVWKLFLLGVPGQIAIFLWFRLYRKGPKEETNG